MNVSELTATDLRKSYNGRLVVGGFSINVKAGEVVGLLGPNGAGKTTSFYMIVGLIRPDSGSVVLDWDDITDLPVYARAKAGIGYLPQEPSIFRNLTVRENINLVWEETGKKRYADDLTDELLRQFKITHIADTKGYSLSGGERRRVEIARAMTLRPKFILLDEPFSGIDPIAVADIQSMIDELKEQGFGILITDHNVRETLSITDRTYLIHDGTIFLSGSPEEVAENELAKKFYLGENFDWEGHPHEGHIHTDTDSSQHHDIDIPKPPDIPEPANKPEPAEPAEPEPKPEPEKVSLYSYKDKDNDDDDDPLNKLMYT